MKLFIYFSFKIDKSADKRPVTFPHMSRTWKNQASLAGHPEHKQTKLWSGIKPASEEKIS